MYVLRVVRVMETKKLSFLESLSSHIGRLECGRAEDLGLHAGDLNMSNIASRQYRSPYRKKQVCVVRTSLLLLG